MSDNTDPPFVYRSAGGPTADSLNNPGQPSDPVYNGNEAVGNLQNQRDRAISQPLLEIPNNSGENQNTLLNYPYRRAVIFLGLLGLAAAAAAMLPSKLAGGPATYIGPPPRHDIEPSYYPPRPATPVMPRY